MDFRFVLRHVREGTIDRVAVAIASQRRVARQTWHALAGLALALNRRAVVTVLDAQPAFAGFIGSGKRIESFIGPIIENRLERRHDQRAVERLGVIQLLVLIGGVVAAGIHLY